MPLNPQQSYTEKQIKMKLTNLEYFLEIARRHKTDSVKNACKLEKEILQEALSKFDTSKKIL